VRITLNLATRPFADLGPAIKRLRIAMGVMAALSIGFGIGLHFLHHKAELARARDHSLDGQLLRITGERQRYTDMMHQPPNAELLTEVGNLNQLFDEKQFSWTLAMEDLEVVLPGGVQVSSIEPVRDKNGQITLHLRVAGPRDREDALVQNLEHSKRFLSPRIVGENAEANEGANNRVVEPVGPSNRFNFDLLAEYNPATLGELTAAEKAGPSAEKKAAAMERPAEPAGARSAQPPVQMGAAPARPGRVPYTGQSRPANPRANPRGNTPANLPPNAGGPQ
jgi:type IV pilus assembly protein PilN